MLLSFMPTHISGAGFNAETRLEAIISCILVARKSFRTALRGPSIKNIFYTFWQTCEMCNSWKNTHMFTHLQ